MMRQYNLTRILLVLITLCLAVPTVIGHKTSEEIEYQKAEKKLGDARWEATKAAIAYTRSESYYNTVNSEWSSSIQSLSRSTLSILSIDPVAAARNSLFSVQDWFSYNDKSNERETALADKNTKDAAWQTALSDVQTAEIARDSAYDRYMATVHRHPCGGGCNGTEIANEHYVPSTTSDCKHSYYTCQPNNHRKHTCTHTFTYDHYYYGFGRVQGVVSGCGQPYWQCLAGSSHALVQCSICKHYYYACVGHDCS